MSCGCNQPVSCGCQSSFGGCSGGSGSGGSFVFNKDLIPISDNVFNIGSPTKRVRSLFLGTDLVLSCASVIRQMTSINEDECITTITGAGFPIITRGAVAQFAGNENVSLNGGISFITGDNALADLLGTATRNIALTSGAATNIVAGSDFSLSAVDDGTITVGDDFTEDIGGLWTVTAYEDISISTLQDLNLTATLTALLTVGSTFTINANAQNRWVFEADGDFAGDATNGGNIIITTANKGVLIGVSALDADVGNPAGLDVVAAGGAVKGLRTLANTNVATAIGVFGYKTRGTGTDANTIVQSGDDLLKIAALGADGVVYRDAAQILFKVDATPGSGDMPGAIAFLTSADGAVTPLERFRINSAGNLLQDATNGGSLIITRSLTGVLLGATSLDADAGNQPRLAIVGALASGGGASLFSVGNNATSMFISGYKTRSTSTDANTVVQASDELLTIYALGADGTDYEQAAKIVFTVDGTPGNNDMPGAINFYTTPDGSNSPLSRFKIGQDGVLHAVTGNMAFDVAAGGLRFNQVTTSGAGTNQATATTLSGKLTIVDNANGTVGVRMPANPLAGEMYFIFNYINAILKLYPAVGASINQAGTDNVVNIAGTSMVVLWATSNTQWLAGEMPGA